MENSNSSFLIRLSADDNVMVVARSLHRNEAFQIGDKKFATAAPLGLGHKIAARDIKAGEKILKYGTPIGSATCDIAQGDHVHLHNMKSDYLPTFTLDEDRKYASAH